MIPDGLQYFLDDFWNFQKCYQLWTLGPCIYHQKYCKKYKNSMGASLENIFISRNLKIWKCWKAHAHVFLFEYFVIGISIIWNMRIQMKLLNFKNWKYYKQNLEIGRFENRKVIFVNVIIWTFEIWTFGNVETGNFEKSRRWFLNFWKVGKSKTGTGKWRRPPP